MRNLAGLLLGSAADLLGIGLGLFDDRPDVLGDDGTGAISGLPHLSVLLVDFLTVKHALDSPFWVISR